MHSWATWASSLVTTGWQRHGAAQAHLHPMSCPSEGTGDSRAVPTITGWSPTPILCEEQLVNTAPSQADGLEQNKQEPSAGAWQSWRRGTAWRVTSGLSLLHMAHLEGCHTPVTSSDKFREMNLGLVWPQQQKGRAADKHSPGMRLQSDTGCLALLPLLSFCGRALCRCEHLRGSPEFPLCTKRATSAHRALQGFTQHQTHCPAAGTAHLSPLTYTQSDGSCQNPTTLWTTSLAWWYRL